ncbi:hypothetical protein HJC23_000068 [Cyclotella cryptica]|uniref:Spc7 kinetochore protein domain-containing protein n=1 Tax=Cyclotella cryptica TaxID=29204 RepID=A0ABD3PHK7_9STRA|eukprot:CCRYP_014394-RA/>CCRYP_014394-RA protein AED:0.02 eAED:0.02 QI:0/-1/0/1/-1/1/1/0/1843
MPTRMTDEENIHSNIRNSEPRVRWKNDTPTQQRQKQPAFSSSSTGGGAIAETPQNKATPSKKMSSTKKKFQEDAVAAYHFAGVPNTPWSKKKTRHRDSSHRHHGNQKQDTPQRSKQQQQQNVSVGEREINHDIHENTFNLGGTASLASIYGDLNSSVLSEASSGGYSNKSGVSSEASDMMNRTTLSDTHELSTSNFIMSHKVRGIVRERAKSLGLGDEKKVVTGDDDAMRGKIAEESMTLPDLTLGDLDDVLAKATVDNEEKPGQNRNDKKDETMEDRSGEGQMIEFTSHHRRTPEKNNATFEDSTASSLELSDLLDSSKDKSSMECEEDKIDQDDISPENDEEKKFDEVEQSFVESTASQNYLDGVLNAGENQEEAGENLSAAKVSKESNDLSEKECIATNNKSATSSINNFNSTPPMTQLNNGKLRQSPSFLSGKKNVVPWRKSVGDEELSKIRALTASLRKRNRDKFGGRMSLPAAKAQSSVIEKEGTRDHASKGSVRALFPEAPEATEVEHVSAVTLASPKKSESFSLQFESPKRNTPSPARLSVDALRRKNQNNRNSVPSQGAKDAALAEDDKSMEFISHQRNTPAKQKELAILDNSSTASSLGLTDLLGDLDDITEKSIMDCDESGMDEIVDASLGLGSLAMNPKSPLKRQFPSPRAPAIDSPARNTRSKRKLASSPAQSPSKIIDSPARNTRSPSAQSLAMSPSKNIDSPARNTRSARKIASSPAKSPSKPSPARSLFTSPLSPSAFNQLDSPTDEAASSVAMEVSGQGPFSRRQRNSSPSEGAGKPLKKCSSLETSPSSPHTDTFSLSKEYPFLSIAKCSKSPIAKSASTDIVAIGQSPDPDNTQCGANTLMFNALMEDMQGLQKSAASEDSNVDLSSGVSSFSDGCTYNATHARKKRRETANFSDLMDILGSEEKDAPGDQNEIHSVASPSKLHTPRASSIKTPKSILNSSNKKESKRSSKKLVVFGSPETAVYNIGSPSSSFTPMQPKAMRRKYASVNDEAEHTTELEGDITQMIAKASDPSLMGPIDESRIEEADFPSDTSSIDISSLSQKGSCQIFRGERTEELETNMCSLLNNSGEESEFSLPSVSEDSGGTPSNVKSDEQSISMPVEKVAEMSSMDIEETAVLEGNLSALVREHQGLNYSPIEETQTVAIEGTMASLLNVASDNSSVASKANSQTMEIEGTLASLVDVVDDDADSPRDYTGTIEVKGTSSSLLHDSKSDMNYEGISFGQDPESLPDAKPKANHQSNWTRSTLTISLDRNLEALVDGSSQPLSAEYTHNHMDMQSAKDKAPATMSEATRTMPLDANLEQLLGSSSSVNSQRESGSIQFSKEHVSGEDDTVSELGMNTSQELSNNSDVQSTLDNMVQDAPLEPLDLELDDLLELGMKDLKFDTQDDVILNALEVSSKKSFGSIKTETEDILAQVCFDIESQVSTIGVESHFSAILQRKRDTMMILQRNLRENDENTSNLVNRFIQAANVSMISEWNAWLTEVATLYNDQLYNTAIGELEKDSVAIADKTSDINYNREQVALPLLLLSARRATQKNYQRQQAETMRLDDEVTKLAAELKDAERELEKLLTMNGKITAVAKSNEHHEILSQSVTTIRREADSSFYKFLSVEKLHNWIVTASNDSYISIVFQGSTPETNLHLSFWITESSNTAFDCKVGPLPRSVKSLLTNQQVRHHPAVSGFLNSKMSLFCRDLKENTRLESASQISSLIHSVEHKVARIKQAANEFDAILGKCKNSFLQPSDSLKDGFDFHAYITSASHQNARLQVVLTLSDCYPFAPIRTSLHSTDTSLDTKSMARQLKKIIKPGFGALSSAIESVHGLLV